MPERYLERGQKSSANPQSAPEKPAQMQAQEAASNSAIPPWMEAVKRGRRTFRMSR